MRFAPQQASHMSQNLRDVIFDGRKAPAAAGKTSTGLIHIIRPRNAIFAEKKAPAAAGKISTGLIHSIKSQERHFRRSQSRNIFDLELIS